MHTTSAEPEPLADPLTPPAREDLEPTGFLELEDELVRRQVARARAGAADEHELAARLFAAVRDEIRYDPYAVSARAADYRAGAVLRAGSGFCVQKAVVLTALARAAGLPARLGFADVRNHLQTERLRERMGTDLFVWHGYSVLFVGGRWTKASPAFNRELCARFGVPPLDYDGSADALLHAFAADGSRYMEYLNDHGVYRDLPLARIIAGNLAAYPALATHAAREGGV